MSKRGGYPGGMGGFGGMNINKLMKEAKKMQADMEKSQEELASREFENSVGGGVVSVRITGEKVIKEIKIEKEVVDPEDVETLQDLILTCINGAMQKADKGSFFMEESLTSDYVIYTNLLQSLTKREKELAGLFFQNKNEEEIARLMGITTRAVDNYMTRILSKLAVGSKKELIKKFGDI